MMPKKPPEKKRSIMIGIKTDETTRKKLKYLADSEGTTISTYVFNLIIAHLKIKEPWITKEIAELEKQ